MDLDKQDDAFYSDLRDGSNLLQAVFIPQMPSIRHLYTLLEKRPDLQLF